MNRSALKEKERTQIRVAHKRTARPLFGALDLAGTQQRRVFGELVPPNVVVEPIQIRLHHRAI